MSEIEIECEECEGKGYIEKTYNKGNQFVAKQCRVCDGTGWVMEDEN